jgi:hypothetical protein
VQGSCVPHDLFFVRALRGARRPASCQPLTVDLPARGNPFLATRRYARTIALEFSGGIAQTCPL